MVGVGLIPNKLWNQMDVINGLEKKRNLAKTLVRVDLFQICLGQLRRVGAVFGIRPLQNALAIFPDLFRA